MGLVCLDLTLVCTTIQKGGLSVNIQSKWQVLLTVVNCHQLTLVQLDILMLIQTLVELLVLGTLNPQSLIILLFLTPTFGSVMMCRLLDRITPMVVLEWMVQTTPVLPVGKLLGIVQAVLAVRLAVPEMEYLPPLPTQTPLYLNSRQLQ